MDKSFFKILIVDDDEATRGLYKEVFSEAGFIVIEAADGVEGLEKVTAEKPDVIFSGIIMPRLDGFGFMEALRGNVNTASIPVAFCSHLGRVEDRDRAKELGVRDFIVRDIVTPKEVISRIRALLSNDEYLLSFHTNELDAQKLALHLGINQDFRCDESGGTHFALRLRIKNRATRELDAELVCIP